MKFDVVPTEDFGKELKQIAKKHRGILSDVAKLSNEIKENPNLGVHLGQNVYKIRLAISGTSKGKSEGARVITYVLIDNKTVFLAEIYLKSEYDSVNADKVIQKLREAGVI